MRHQSTPLFKLCVVCGAVMVRQSHQPDIKFRSRQTCCRPCTAKLIGQKERGRVKPLPEDRHCVVCDAVLVRGDAETRGNFRRRRACGPDCRRSLRKSIQTKRTDELQTCVWCGRAFGQRSGESLPRFRARMACSVECKHAYIVLKRPYRQRKQRRNEYSPAFRRLRPLVRERDGHRCRLCGARGAALDVHHIDHDKNHNEMSNLISLCKSCHTKTRHHHDRLRPILERMMRGMK